MTCSRTAISADTCTRCPNSSDELTFVEAANVPGRIVIFRMERYVVIYYRHEKGKERKERIYILIGQQIVPLQTPVPKITINKSTKEHVSKHSNNSYITPAASSQVDRRHIQPPQKNCRVTTSSLYTICRRNMF